MQQDRTRRKRALVSDQTLGALCGSPSECVRFANFTRRK
jgi:hypothetical protein